MPLASRDSRSRLPCLHFRFRLIARPKQTVLVKKLAENHPDLFVPKIVPVVVLVSSHQELGAEFAFLEFLVEIQVRDTIPQPIKLGFELLFYFGKPLECWIDKRAELHHHQSTITLTAFPLDRLDHSDHQLQMLHRRFDSRLPVRWKRNRDVAKRQVGVEKYGFGETIHIREPNFLGIVEQVKGQQHHVGLILKPSFFRNRYC